MVAIPKFIWAYCRKCGGPCKQINPAWLRQKRESHGYSLRATALKFGVSAPYLSDVELGHRRCTAILRVKYEAMR